MVNLVQVHSCSKETMANCINAVVYSQPVLTVSITFNLVPQDRDAYEAKIAAALAAALAAETKVTT